MPILSRDQAIAGALPPFNFLKIGSGTHVVGRLMSYFYMSGMPGAAVAPTPGLSGAALTSYAGQMPFSNPASGNTHLMSLSASASVAGTIILCDRLWHNSGINVTSTSQQTINSVALPSRCVPESGSDPNTDGFGVMVGLEVSATMGAGASAFTMGYTNSDGTSGRSIVTAAQSAGMLAGSFIPIPLQASDKGVRSIQTWQQSVSMTSGTYRLVMYREIARVQVPFVGATGSVNMITSGFPRLYDNSVPFLLWFPVTSTAPSITGSLSYTQG